MKDSTERGWGVSSVSMGQRASAGKNAWSRGVGNSLAFCERPRQRCFSVTVLSVMGGCERSRDLKGIRGRRGSQELGKHVSLLQEATISSRTSRVTALVRG